MGKIITANTAEIKPAQIGLNSFKMKRVLSFYEEGREDDLLPISARLIGDQLFALDGTHRTIIKDMTPDRKIQVYVPDHARDYVTPETFEQRIEFEDPEETQELMEAINELINFNFREVLRIGSKLERSGINTHEDLRKTYGINSMSDAEEFAKQDVSSPKWKI